MLPRVNAREEEGDGGPLALSFQPEAGTAKLAEAATRGHCSRTTDGVAEQEDELPTSTWVDGMSQRLERLNPSCRLHREEESFART
jgi:hypothetical protein